MDGYKELIHDVDEQSLMSEHDKFVVRSKAKYLKYACVAALKNMDGLKDAYMQVREDTSLKMMMEQQSDLIDELTLLQHRGQSLRVIVDRTPKCRPEMASEGIEYSWGCTKQYYNFLPINRKKGMQAFWETVKESVSLNIPTIERQRKFSRRAREYMLAYK